MSDRSFGYVILLFLLALLLIPLYYLSRPLHDAHHRLSIVFPTVNTLNFLKIQDPVRIQGMAAGTVKSITWKNGATVVIVEVQPRVELYPGYRITAAPVGFMGDRCLEIEPGDNRSPPIDPKEPIIGQFLTGPAETIGYAKSLEEKVAALSGLIRKLRDGNGKTPPFATRFGSAEKILDSISRSLVLLLHRADDRSGAIIDSIGDFAENTGHLSRELATTLPGTESQVESVLVKSEELFQASDSGIAALRSLVSRIAPADSTGAAEAIATLSRQLSALRTYSRAIRQDGLKLRVRL